MEQESPVGAGMFTVCSPFDDDRGLHFIQNIHQQDLRHLLGGNR